MTWPLGLLWLFIALTSGIYLVAVLDRFLAYGISGQANGIGRCFLSPAADGARLLLQQRSRTERPDTLNWRLAAVSYLTLTGIALSLVPFAPNKVVLDVQAGIVVWGAVEALTIVTIFLHGWSANAALPLLGGYRYVAIGLSAMLVSMFVLIAVALPAESMRLQVIVQSQTGLWNILWQPLGFVLFIVLGLAVSLRGPLNYADSTDLAGGTRAEVAASDLLLWQFSRHGILFAFSAMAATVFLGGHGGTGLSGTVWLLAKTVIVLMLTLLCGHFLARVTPSRMLSFIWLVLLPLSFLHLLFVGLMTLYGFQYGTQ